MVSRRSVKAVSESTSNNLSFIYFFHATDWVPMRFIKVILSLVLCFSIFACGCQGASGTETSSLEWEAWASEIENEVFTILEEQGTVALNPLRNNIVPQMLLDEGRPTLGNADADTSYLDSQGVLSGRIAIFYDLDSLTYIEYSEEYRYALRDEVLDASAYLDIDHAVPLPLSAAHYASSPKECDTLVIIISDLVLGDEREAGEKAFYDDTSVIIINARTKQLEHIEYLGVCLMEKTSENSGAFLMMGEAMLYLASLNHDGVTSSQPYTTPYQNGIPAGATPAISDEDWPDGEMVREYFIAAGDFGVYNTIVLGVIERNTLSVSQQKVKTLVVRLYYIEAGQISSNVAAISYKDATFNNSDPYNLEASFMDGSVIVKGCVDYNDFQGVLIIGNTRYSFFAPIVAAQDCPDCEDTDPHEDTHCPHCDGIGAMAYYEYVDLLL